MVIGLFLSEVNSIAWDRRTKDTEMLKRKQYLDSPRYDYLPALSRWHCHNLQMLHGAAVGLLLNGLATIVLLGFDGLSLNANQSNEAA